MVGMCEILDKGYGKNLVLVRSVMTPEFLYMAYLPPLYRDSVCDMENGDKVFVVADDDSGLGAVLFKVDDGIAAEGTMNFKHKVHVDEDLTVDGKIKTTSKFVGKATITADNVLAMLGCVTIANGAGNCVITIGPNHTHDFDFVEV